VINEVGQWKFWILWDRRSIFDQTSLKTECSTKQEFNEIHMGPEFELNERIAN